MRKILLLSLLIALATPAFPGTASDEEREILQWRAQRRSKLTGDDGWLTLVGLQWLHEGINKVENPRGAVVTLHGGAVTLQSSRALTIGGKPVGAPTLLIDDTNPKGPTVVSSGTVRFHVIARSGKFGLRVRDTASPARKHFLALDYFPVNPAWRVEGRFERYDPPRQVAITNVLGMTSDEVAPGVIVFKVGGKEYRLQPILEQGETDYFIIFKDATSGKETYPAARYVYAPPPDRNGRTVIDFNKAYNPPCAFTSFATCPLPPPQNRLPFRVEAGEKRYRGGHS